MGLHLREFLSFEDATAASQNRVKVQVPFKALLKAEYEQSDQGDLFDMATGEHLPHGTIVASHIFLYRWRRQISHHSAINDVNDVRNGLLLCKPVDWAFNRAKICIEVNSAGKMTFRLLDYDLSDVRLADKAYELRHESGCGDEPIGREVLQRTFGDLNRREVQFPIHSTMRPSKRLLGLHAVAAWVEARGDSPDSEIPLPECNTSDMDIARPSLKLFIEGWRTAVPEHLNESFSICLSRGRNGVAENGPVSESQSICSSRGGNGVAEDGLVSESQSILWTRHSYLPLKHV